MCILFFPAEDGIRDHCVTGVQTCALPISALAYIKSHWTTRAEHLARCPVAFDVRQRRPDFRIRKLAAESRHVAFVIWRCEIGRASCRERVVVSVVAVS